MTCVLSIGCKGSQRSAVVRFFEFFFLDDLVFSGANIFPDPASVNIVQIS